MKRITTSRMCALLAGPQRKTRLRGGLYALKVLFDFAPAETQHHRPAMRTDRRVRRPPQFVEDVGHLLRRQWIVGFHRRMTRHRRGDLFDRIVYGGRIPPGFEILGQRTQHSRTFFAPEQRRKCRYPHRLAAELFDIKPETFELSDMRCQGLTAARRQLEDHRFEQPLALQLSGRQAFGDAYEEHTLVCDMLIDDGDALLVHGDDERVAELAERHHWPDRRCG